MIQIKKFIYTTFLLFGALATHAQDNLDIYLTEAVQNNPGVKSKFNDYMAALEKVPQVATLPDPQVTFGYFAEPVETRNGPQKARISASQLFPWFGTFGAKKSVAIEMAKSRYETFEEARSHLTYEIETAYYDLYFIKKGIDITGENISILNTLRQMVLIKVEAGLASSVDVLRVDMERADLENQLALLNDNYVVSQTRFNHLLNVAPNRQVALPDSLRNVNIGMLQDAILDSIRNRNHEVLQLNHLETSYANQEIVARKSGKPSLMLGFDYIVIGKSAMAPPSESGKDAIAFPTVGISIPIYRRKYKAMEQEATLMQQSAQYSLQDKINTLGTSFEQSQRDYNDADRRISLNIAQLIRSGKALSMLQTAYESDGKNFEEVLRMESRVLKYRLELEKARSDKDKAIANLDYLMGK